MTKENEVLEKDGGMLGICYEAYDTERLYKLASTTVGANTVFPPLGALNKDTQGKPTTAKSKAIGTPNLEETAFLNEGYRRATNVPTLSACYNFERRYKENKKIIEANKVIMKQYESAINGNKAKEGVKLVAELMFKNSAEMGFLNASNIASTNILINNLDLFANTQVKEASVERTMELDAQVSGYETSNIVSSNFPIYAGMRWIALNSAYMMVPPASTIKKDIAEPFVGTALNLVTNLSKIIPLPTNGISDLVSSALNQIQSKKTNVLNFEDMEIIKVFTSFLALIFTILVMKFFLTYMPLVAISVASYLAIGFYYISVEIFYLVAPFVAIYALATEQSATVTNFMKRFLALAFKPVFIVLSIIMAMMALEIFDTLAQITSHKTFDSFFAITELDRTQIDYNGSFELLAKVANGTTNFLFDFKDYGLLFFKGIVKVGSQVVSLLAVFYLVFYGSTMILNIFGLKDSGIDAQDTVGNAFDNKASKFSTM